MIRWTTPSIPLTVEGVDLTGAEVWVTVEQGSTVLTVEDPAVSYADGVSTVTPELTQEQTALFSAGDAKIQLNWKIAGTRDATAVKAIRVLPYLLDLEL